MSERFDPYHVWLGIPPEEQPANHYRLLGLRLFESNAAVIDNAADRAMAHVRGVSVGMHSSAAQQLLGELSCARVCLLSDADRARYDAELRLRLGSPAAAPVHPAYAPPWPVAPTPQHLPVAMAMPRPQPAALVNSAQPMPLPAPQAEFEPAFPIVAPSEGALGKRTGRGVSSRAGPRKSKRGAPFFVQVVAGGVVGLAIAYSLAGNLVGFDPLGVFPARQTGDDDAVAADEDTPNKVERTPVARPPRNPSAASRSPRVVKTDLPANPAPQVLRFSWEGFPRAVELPPVASGERVLLGELPANMEPAKIKATLRLDLVELSEGESVSLGPSAPVEGSAKDGSAADGDEWTVVFLTKTGARQQIARLAWDGRGMFFSWLPSAVVDSSAARLANAVLALEAGTQSAMVALRKPVIVPAVTIGLQERQSQHTLWQGPFPRRDLIWIEIGGHQRLPAPFIPEMGRSQISARDKTFVTWLGPTLNEADKPKLTFKFDCSEANALILSIERTIVTPKGAFELTTTNIATVRKEAQEKFDPVNREWEKVRKEGRAVQEEIQRLTGAGIRNAAQRAAIARLRAQVNVLKPRFDRLDAERSQFDAILRGIPAVEELVSKIDGAGEAQFRVFAKANDIEVDVVRSAGWGPSN